MILIRKQYLETGKIVGTHGLKGEMRVQPWSDSPDFLTAFDCFYLDDHGTKQIEVESCRVHGNIVLMKASGVGSIEQAERLRGKVLFINRQDVNLPEGSRFVQDLLGCRVYHADTGDLLGTLSDISKTGANDIWHMKRDQKEYLIPAIPDVIVDVDEDAGKVIIRPLKGIFDDED